MKHSRFLLRRGLILAAIIMTLVPVSAFAQRRWERSRHRSRVVVYQPRPYVIYQRQPYYNYRTYSYQAPYYSGSYYSSSYYSPYTYNYSRPYRLNQYSWRSPRYRYYNYYGDRYRQRRSGLRIRFSLR
jgi:hypothetical protein